MSLQSSPVTLVREHVLATSKQTSRIGLLHRDLAKRMGLKHAAAALARKLAMVMHATWHSSTPSQARPA